MKPQRKGLLKWILMGCLKKFSPCIDDAKILQHQKYDELSPMIAKLVRTYV